MPSPRNPPRPGMQLDRDPCTCKSTPFPCQLPVTKCGLQEDLDHAVAAGDAPAAVLFYAHRERLCAERLLGLFVLGDVALARALAAVCLDTQLVLARHEHMHL